jgi:acyl-coenzyme A thioesterase PaaI-like protein
MGAEKSEKKSRIPLPRYASCFVCGEQNPIGFDITFYYTNSRIETYFTPQARHTGYRNITHGGILATLLDECMGWAGVLSRPVICKSVELCIRYKQSALAGEPLTIWGDLEADKNRLLLFYGGIENSRGETLCQANGKYMPLRKEELDDFTREAGWGNALVDVYHQIQESRRGL